MTRLRCSTAGLTCASSATAAQATPTMPAAASACPADDFAAASVSGRRGVDAELRMGAAEDRRHASAALISMGSPRAVPVPCIWSVLTCQGTGRPQSQRR